MKVAVITLHAVPNYGSVLQALATQKLLTAHGLDVEIINYIRKDITYHNLYNHWGGRNPLKRLVIHPTIQRWKKVFGEYCSKNLNLSEYRYYSMADFKAHPVKADLYCTGSDQVWNTKWNKGVLPEFYLAFAPEKAYRFAFAASIGKDSIDAREVELTSEFIKKYRYISMREKSAEKLVAEKYHFDKVCTVLDPTLGLSAKEWRALMSKDRIDGDYILIYNLNRSKQFDEYASKLSKKTGLKLVRLCTRYDQFYRVGKSVLVPEIPEFISLIANARYVLTDSFHATAFSINMNTEPICVLPPEFSDRVKGFLKLMNAESRLVHDYSDFSVLKHHLNFTEINATLDEKRAEMHKFIETVADDAQNYYSTET